MRCADVMRREPVDCHEEETILSAAVKMRDANVGFCPVKNEDGQVTGALTDRDIVIRCCAEMKDTTRTLVRDIMTTEVHFVRTTDALTEAEELMSRRKVSRVMVMDHEGTLLGVISLSDLGKADWGWRVARTVKEVVVP